jgi:hypothetical protein
MNNVHYFLLTTEKNIKRRNIILNTWLKNKNYIFFSDTQNLKEKILKTSERDDYYSNEEKFINGLNYILKNKNKFEDFEWFMFCDDDSYVNEKNLLLNIHNFDKTKFIGFVLNKQNDPQNKIFIDNNFEYLSGGAGILINKKLLFKIEQFINYNTNWSDVSFGFFLKNNKFELENCSLFNANNFDKLGHSIEEIKKQITYHYIKEKDEIEFLYELEKN